MDMLELRLTGLTFTVIQNLESHSEIVWENQLRTYVRSENLKKNYLVLIPLKKVDIFFLRFSDIIGFPKQFPNGILTFGSL